MVFHKSESNITLFFSNKNKDLENSYFNSNYFI